MGQLAKDGFFSFSTLPLWLSTYLFAFSYAAFLLLGVQLIGLGIIGEYHGRIYRETKQPPLYVIE